MNGLKPEPFSVFLLPGQKEQSIKISNRLFDELQVEIEKQHDDTFTLEIKKEKAGKEEQMEIVVKPSPELKKGTYLSNLH